MKHFHRHHIQTKQIEKKRNNSNDRRSKTNRTIILLFIHLLFHFHLGKFQVKKKTGSHARTDIFKPIQDQTDYVELLVI
jgi:hypothetical protein